MEASGAEWFVRYAAQRQRSNSEALPKSTANADEAQEHTVEYNRLAGLRSLGRRRKGAVQPHSCHTRRLFDVQKIVGGRKCENGLFAIGRCTASDQN